MLLRCESNAPMPVTLMLMHTSVDSEGSADCDTTAVGFYVTRGDDSGVPIIQSKNILVLIPVVGRFIMSKLNNSTIPWVFILHFNNSIISFVAHTFICESQCTVQTERKMRKSIDLCM